ncbi:shikimate kinase [Williamsia limnetica]|uniref:Shikimate kinase n=2 Tax=Williamsia limnetica TaxID=882452 RepID=A0A318RTS0_WILLI|nr:shikimate kinase [Williamsia limnetica]PYE21049.1 shikimate kinase [Williamsia limnetica]
MTGRLAPRAVLVGFMGSGKTTVGQQLARALGVAWIDSDGEIERRAGRTIPEIFTADGEPAFREFEEQVVADLLAEHPGVLSLGGGAVLSTRTRERLAGHPVIYLKMSAEQGYSRVSNSDRPLLQAEDPSAVYRDLLAERDPIYQAVATIVVDAHPHQRRVADDIIAALRTQEATQ